MTKNSGGRNATFSIRGVQRDAAGDENVIELITEGDVIFSEDCVFLRYDESEISGMEGSRTSIELRGNSVDMVREGDTSVTMHFEKGKHHHSHYQTPYGAISISVFGNSVYHKVNERGGKVRLDYHIDMDGEQSFENTFSIDVKVK